MAVENSSLGLKSIKIADVVANGLPTSFTVEIPDAQIDSATVTETEPTREDIRTEQRKGVYRRITTEDGSVSYTVQTYDLSTDQLEALKGGTVTPATATVGKRWGRTEQVEMRKAVEIITLDDFKILFPNADVMALITWPTAKGALGTLTITFTALDHPMGDVIIEEPLAD